VAVVATANAAVTVTVTYPNGQTDGIHAKTDDKGLFQWVFTVPTSAGTGLARVVATTATDSKSAVFSVL